MMIRKDDPRYAPVALRRELLAQGWDDRTINRAVRDGSLVRVRYGSYVDRDTWASLDEAGRYAARCHAVQRRSAAELVLSHTSALPAYGAPLWGLDLELVHGTRRDGRAGRKEAGVRQHAGLLLEEDVTVVDGVPVTSPVRTGLDITMVSPAVAALCVVNHLLHTEQVTLESLRDRYEATSSVQRQWRGTVVPVGASMKHWPGSLRTDLVLRLADGRCESVGESRTYYLVAVHGLPMPELQHEVRDERGKLVARLDFAWPELGVFLEFDGKVKYTDLVPEGESVVDVVLREKRREEMVTELTGWRCIRVTWADLENPERLVARIRAVLSERRRAS